MAGTAAVRQRGVVVVWLAARRFGFIQPAERGAEDVFFHCSALLNEATDTRQMVPGVQVEYEVMGSPKGPRAERVAVVTTTTTEAGGDV